MAYNILIVDDSVITRTVIKRSIDMTGIDTGEIFEADNGLSALEVLEKHHVDLVLADLNMPEMDGGEMLHQMQRDEATKSVPVVVVSSEPSTIRIKQLLAEGIKDYLHKPFAPEEFAEIVKHSLGETDD
jgi:CheY-like chemotaxis protein